MHKICWFLQNPELRFNKASHSLTRFAKNHLVGRLTLTALLGTFLFVITAAMLCLSCKKNHNTTPFPEETGFCRARLLLGFWSKMLRKMSSVQVLLEIADICQNEITCTSESTHALLPISDSSAIFCLQETKVPHVPRHLSPYLAKAICFGVPRIDCCLLVSLQLWLHICTENVH